MQRIFILVLVIPLVIVSFINKRNSVLAQTSPTEIIVNQSQIIREVNPLVFGQNLYANFWGVRADDPKKLEQALKEAGTTILRFPGGLYADEFHWYEAIGPSGQRPKVCYQADYGKIFLGLDEFLNLAERVSAEVVFTINEDRATFEEIRDLIEYTNGEVPANVESWTVNSWRHGKEGSSGYISGSMPKGYYAWLRSQPEYGNRVAPWKIKYVEIGNEIFSSYCPQQSPTSSCHREGTCEACNVRPEYGCTKPSGIGRQYDTLNRSCEDSGNSTLRTGVYKYIDRFEQFTNVIQSVDPNIQIGAVGLNGSPTCAWNRALLNSPVADRIDFIVDHPYLPAKSPTQLGLDEFTYSQGVISGVPYTEANLLLPEWEKLLGPKSKKLANTEHSATYTLSADEGNDLRGALMNAGRLHNWLRSSLVLMADYWHFGMSAMYHDWQNENPIPGPTALVYKLYADNIQDQLIDASVVNNPTHQSRDLTYGLGTFQTEDLDVLATVSNNKNTLSVFIINRNIERSNNFTLNLSSFSFKQASKHTLKTKKPEGSLDALLANTNSDPNDVYIETESLESSSQQISETIGPHTLMVLNFSNCSRSDLDCNGRVDIFDYNLLMSDFGKSGEAGFSPADIDSDGNVDIFDYNLLIGNFGGSAI